MNNYTLFLLKQILKIKLPLENSKIIKEIAAIIPHINKLFSFKDIFNNIVMLKLYYMMNLSKIEEFNNNSILEFTVNSLLKNCRTIF